MPSALSILDIVYILHTGVMGPNDRFVLSKGHGCLALYAVLAHVGRIPDAWADDFCEPRSPWQGHPERHGPVEFSTGSLGHGICAAVGMAYAKRIKGEPGRVYCLIGDGEAQEGSVFEAMRLADDLNLKNLTVIVDLNEPSRERHARRLSMFSDFIFNVDGHNHTDLKRGFQMPPRLLFAKTVKGCGIPEMEREPKAWHHRSYGLGQILEQL